MTPAVLATKSPEEVTKMAAATVTYHNQKAQDAMNVLMLAQKRIDDAKKKRARYIILFYCCSNDICFLGKSSKS